MSLFRRAFLGVALTTSVLTASAATFNVTRFDDPAPGGCLAFDCSLREAVIAANANPGLDQVRLSSGTYVLTRPGGVSDPLGNDLDVTDRLEIVGNGAAVTIIRAAFASTTQDTRIINVAGAAIWVRDLAMRDGAVAAIGGLAEGGCFKASGTTVVFNRVLISNCSASLGGGVALRNSNLQSDATTIRSNSALHGGGMYLLGTSSLDGSSVRVDQNIASSRGGGLYLLPPSSAAFSTTLRWATGSQIVGNQAMEGGGIYATSDHTLRIEPVADSTPGDDELLFIAGNHASNNGGGLYVNGALQATRLAVRANSANAATSDGGGLYSAGHSIVSDSEFAFNTVVRDGGGAFIRSTGSGRFERVSFADNYVGRYGGGLANQGYALLINVATFSNDAAAGGGIDFSGSGRIYHVSMLADTGHALRAFGSPLVVNSVVSGGCAPGSILMPAGTNAQAAGFSSCGGAIPSYSAAQLNQGYAYTGGRFDVVAIAGAASVLRNAAAPVPEAPNDIRGWLRLAAFDIGAHEFDATAP